MRYQTVDIPITKILDTKSGAAHYIYWIKCNKCDNVVPVPEIYYAWHKRILDSQPDVVCNMCDGLIETIDEDIYARDFWETGPVPREHISDTLFNKKFQRELDDDDGGFSCHSVGIGYANYLISTGFEDALKELKSFIIKE